MVTLGLSWSTMRQHLSPQKTLKASKCYLGRLQHRFDKCGPTPADGDEIHLQKSYRLVKNVGRCRISIRLRRIQKGSSDGPPTTHVSIGNECRELLVSFNRVELEERTCHVATSSWHQANLILISSHVTGSSRLPMNCGVDF